MKRPLAVKSTRALAGTGTRLRARVAASTATGTAATRIRPPGSPLAPSRRTACHAPAATIGATMPVAKYTTSSRPGAPRAKLSRWGWKEKPWTAGTLLANWATTSTAKAASPAATAVGVSALAMVPTEQKRPMRSSAPM